MWFSLFALVLILTITFFQGLQGLFSAFITFVLTVLAAALAFGSFESLYLSQLFQFLPERGRPVALVGIFVIALLVLRGVFDAVIKGNMQFPAVADRIGGGVFGFLTAMVIVGILSLGLNMLSFGPRFLGYARYSLVDPSGQPLAVEQVPGEAEEESAHAKFLAKLDWSQARRSQNGIWLNPDGFTVSLMSYLSGNALQGQNRLADVYPDFIEAALGGRSSYSNASAIAVPPDTVSLEGYWDMPAKSFYVLELAEKSEKSSRSDLYQFTLDDEPAGPDSKLIVVRIRIKNDTADKGNFHRFTTQQVRLVGRRGKGGPTIEFYPAGINHAEFARWYRIYPGQGVARKGGKDGLTMDLVFEVPASADFTPWFLEYKQNARVELTPALDKSEKAPGPFEPQDEDEAKKNDTKDKKKKSKKSKAKEEKPEPQADSSSDTDESKAKRRSGDRISGVRPTTEGSFFNADLPFVLTSYQAIGDMAISQGTIKGGAGHLIAIFTPDGKPEAGNQPPAQRFEVPEGEQLLQLRVNELNPGSFLGNAAGFARRAIRRYTLVDTINNKYPTIGAYAVADVGGQRTLELIYFDDTARSADATVKFDKVRHDNLKGDYLLYFLFHVPPGTEVKGFDTGNKEEDLRHLGLVAPE